MPRLPFFALLFLAACSGGDSAVRYAVPEAEVAVRARISYASVEVIEVSLPTYASLEEIFVGTADGGLQSSTSLLWADDPTRAVTLELARSLAAITGARVAPEPWPFQEPAAARVDVRVEEMVAMADGVFRLKGQYFVAPRDIDRRERSGAFALVAPWNTEGGAAAIAAARGAVVRDLALQIAKEGL